MEKPYIIVHLGGSVVVPHISDEGGINVSFLQEFQKFISQEIQKGFRFIIVVGGGKIARAYQKSASEIVSIKEYDLDWIGIHATRLNAHLLRTIFEKEAYPVVIDHDPSVEEVQIMESSSRNLFFASGWKPGWSTDYIAVRLAEHFKAKQVLVAKDTPFVYTADPRKDKEAKAVKEISWKEYKKIIPAKWKPGLSSPFDPVATRLAEKLKIEAKIFSATDLANFQNAIEGKKFQGTSIL